MDGIGCVGTGLGLEVKNKETHRASCSLCMLQSEFLLACLQIGLVYLTSVCTGKKHSGKLRYNMMPNLLCIKELGKICQSIDSDIPYVIA